MTASDPILSTLLMSSFSIMQFVTGIGCGVAIGIFLMSRKPRKGKETNVSSEDDSEVSSCDDGGEDKGGRDMKLILVVRNDLKMGKGKVAAQCAHAAVQAYQQAKRKKPKTLNEWERNGQPKIVVKCESQEELLALARRSKELNLITSVIKDAGRTQIAPGSRTVLGVGPGPASEVNEVTSHLKLY